MPLPSLFHPAVSAWFAESLGEPTEVQLRAWPSARSGRHTLIAAPTGSGKTLAAFLAAIDDLMRQGLGGRLAQETQVLYISPLKALGNDIERNLRLPLQGIAEKLKAQGANAPEIAVAVRTGDTLPAERTAMFRRPPHILVTTPESLYLLLTGANGRRMLSTVRTVIVDEIHALVGDKRGSHLSLSLERLDGIALSKPARIGLSATQKPIEKVAAFLTGSHAPPCDIIDAGHSRALDLDLVLPGSPLGAVMANEVWGEIHDRLMQFIGGHRTTLIFVNTRRLAERLAHTLSEKLGSGAVCAHHGSMSKERRHEAEQNLKAGRLRAIVATASLELGIDIGSVDLVCQVGSPRSIAVFLQRVGRSGHSVKGRPKGRLFPLTRDELVECAALLAACRSGLLDEVIIPEKPVDILAQQIVAEVSCAGYGSGELYERMRSAWPYRNLSRGEYDEVVRMLADGYTTRRGRRGAWLHHDRVHDQLRARKGARLTAVISGGAIPDNFDYDVILEPSNTFVGTVNEDFAIESTPGDIFQLGNSSWRILKVETGRVRVEDAGGLPPSIPFWLGEANGRTRELSEAVSRLRAEVSSFVGGAENLSAPAGEDAAPPEWRARVVHRLSEMSGIGADAAEQIADYLAASEAALGAMPTQDTLVLERFFDEAGDMHVVIHSPYGSRLNKAWGLSLRKKFCRKFNFELQAAAGEDALILSLGSTHSFPADEVFGYLKKETVRDVLVQAMFDAPVFGVRWRWNASRALAVIRRRPGGKVPPQIQRMQSEDLIALVFPDQLACLENIAGDREIPDHPLVNQTVHDCLTEAMDIEGLEALLERIASGGVRLIARDLREPSPLAQEIVNARPYAFLDDAPLEERRTNAVRMRRWIDPAEAGELGQLDEGAIAAVREEAWPEASSADELHDALILAGFITEEEGRQNKWQPLFGALAEDGRAAQVVAGESTALWVAAERLHEVQAVAPGCLTSPLIATPADVAGEFAAAGKSPLTELIRSRLEALGPVTAETLAAPMHLEATEAEHALLALENEGFVFRGRFTPGVEKQEWCERRLLARIHRYTLQKLRREIEPVSAAAYMRFLFSWHGVSPEAQEGPAALEAALRRLEGYEAQAAAWESEILPLRVKDYDHTWLDMLCLSGRTVWGRFRPANGSARGPVKTTPVSLAGRSNAALWRHAANGANGGAPLSASALKVMALMKEGGASFYDALCEGSGLLEPECRDALSELVAAGLVTSDSYTGLRALLVNGRNNPTRRQRRARHNFSLAQAGRWSLMPHGNGSAAQPQGQRAAEGLARVLLSRYGVVFRKVAEREAGMPPWRDLVRAFRLLEARGEIRGGRFVAGVWGEQYALPEAIPVLRAARKSEGAGNFVSVSAADPLNLTGILTPGARVPAVYTNRILYLDGEVAATKEGRECRFTRQPESPAEEWKLRNLLIRRNVPVKLKGYLGW